MVRVLSVRSLMAAAVVLALGATTRAADNDFNPYKNAKVGDFATYKMSVKFGPMTFDGTITQTVTEKTDKQAKIKVVGTVAGMQIPAQTQTIDLTKPYDPTKVGGGGVIPGGGQATVKQLKDGKEKVKVGGKEYETTWNTYDLTAMLPGGKFSGNCKVWVSKEAPMGVVKMDMAMEVSGQKIEMTMEMTESGNDTKK